MKSTSISEVLFLFIDKLLLFISVDKSTGFQNLSPFMDNEIWCKRECWFSDETVSYTFPENWELKVLSPKKVNPLSAEEILHKIKHPFGSQPLTSLLDAKKRILILSDDISRPTRTDIIIPIVLEILLQAGIDRKNISILIASGSHDKMTTQEKQLKFGLDIVDSIQIIDHEFLGKSKYIGKSEMGTPIYVNKHLLENDLIIGIGGIYPHNQVGFGGGAKLILGACGYKTIKHLHSSREGATTGESTANEFRKDLIEIARLANLNFIINNLVNSEREIIDIFAGDVHDTFDIGLKEARNLYVVPSPREYQFDLVIADSYPADSSIAFTRKGWWPVHKSHKDAYKLVISASPKGLGNHPLFPIVPNKYQSLINLSYEYRTTSFFNFLYLILIQKTSKATIKVSRKIYKKIIKGKDIKNFVTYKTPSASGSKIALLHNKKNYFRKQKTPISIELIEDFEIYIKYIQEQTNYRPLKVGFYKASGLTFPAKRKNNYN